MDSSRPVLPIPARLTLTILLVLLCPIARHASAQQAKPNLTGTWKLNLSKSKLAPPHGPGGDLYKIKHSEPRLEMVHTFNGKSETYFYMVDGKERLANRSAQDGELRAKAYWDGNTLVIEKHQKMLAGDSVWISRYTLSQDGKSLGITHHVIESSFSGTLDESLTYQKQQ
jgi:hypothetical protein